MDDLRARILIVDDDPGIRVLLRSILKSCGYSCKEASNGLEALEKMEIHAYDLILLEYSMPLMNGLAVIRRIAQKSWDSRPQIIMMTAHTDEAIRNQALEAGAIAALPKPFDVDQGLFTIRQALNNGHPSYPWPQSTP